MNSTAVKAAGAIHTDFEKKFIRAEIGELAAASWMRRLRRASERRDILRLEGKEYIVKDGDVLVIRHG